MKRKNRNSIIVVMMIEYQHKWNEKTMDIVMITLIKFLFLCQNKSKPIVMDWMIMAMKMKHFQKESLTLKNIFISKRKKTNINNIIAKVYEWVDALYRHCYHGYVWRTCTYIPSVGSWTRNAFHSIQQQRREYSTSWLNDRSSSTFSGE